MPVRGRTWQLAARYTCQARSRLRALAIAADRMATNSSGSGASCHVSPAAAAAAVVRRIVMAACTPQGPLQCAFERASADCSASAIMAESALLNLGSSVHTEVVHFLSVQLESRQVAEGPKL